MRVMFDVADIANQYGASKFYEQVREATLAVLEASNLELNEFTIRDFYQRFAYAYIIGVKTRDPQQMLELLTEDTYDPLGDWQDVTDDSGLTILQTEPPEKTLGLDMNNLVITDQFAKGEIGVSTFLTAEGSDEQHALAFEAAAALLEKELTLLTGFAGLIESLYPGRYFTHVGDAFNDVVLICE
ncbi:hypothetical protein pEaSNUABM29_00146 [Erwinia phage pEa_SNUABM_29]|nr:hypothetical protein pEaSNUABM29_00146 [Erwinia phage pEa_SNUABM_29]